MSPKVKQAFGLAYERHTKVGMELMAKAAGLKVKESLSKADLFDRLKRYERNLKSKEKKARVDALATHFKHHKRFDSFTEDLEKAFQADADSETESENSDAMPRHGAGDETDIGEDEIFSEQSESAAASDSDNEAKKKSRVLTRAMLKVEANDADAKAEAKSKKQAAEEKIKNEATPTKESDTKSSVRNSPERETKKSPSGENRKKSPTPEEVQRTSFSVQCKLCDQQLPDIAFNKKPITSKCTHDLNICFACICFSLEKQIEDGEWKTGLRCPVCPGKLTDNGIKRCGGEKMYEKNLTLKKIQEYMEDPEIRRLTLQDSMPEARAADPMDDGE